MMIVGLAVAMVACQGAVGPAGKDGATGLQGPQGEPGDPGDPGISALSASTTSPKTVEVNLDSDNGTPGTPVANRRETVFHRRGAPGHLYGGIGSTLPTNNNAGPYEVDATGTGPYALTDGILNLRVKTASVTTDLSASTTTLPELTNVFSIVATAANGTETVMVTTRANQKPALGSASFNDLSFRIGTQPAATKVATAGVLGYIAAGGLVPAAPVLATVFGHPLDCDSFNGCRINFASDGCYSSRK